jgi:hypothetical protein
MQEDIRTPEVTTGMRRNGFVTKAKGFAAECPQG